MASMRTLRRRLARWNRYAAKTYWNPRVTTPRWMRARSATACSPGHTRAWDAQQREIERRFWEETPEVWLGGPEGEAALLADLADPRCCVAGDQGHDGQCVIRCEGCRGDSRCPECGGVDDLGCWHCDGTGGCPRHCDDGEIVLQEWFS